MIECSKCNGTGYAKYNTVNRINNFYSLFTKIISFFSDIKTKINIEKDCKFCKGNGNVLPDSPIIIKKNNNFIDSLSKSTTNSPRLRKIIITKSSEIEKKLTTKSPKIKKKSIMLKINLSKKKKKRNKTKKNNFKPIYAGW
jgi:hypothetical protein